VYIDTFHYTLGVHVYKCKRKQKEQSIIDNPET